MKAVRFHRYGDSDVLTTSHNPADAAIRAGYLREMLPLTLPHVPGVDVAGTATPVSTAADTQVDVVLNLVANAARLAQLVDRVDAGKLRIDVAERLTLTDLAVVHRRADEGRLPVTHGSRKDHPQTGHPLRSSLLVALVQKVNLQGLCGRDHRRRGPGLAEHGFPSN